MGVWTTFCRRSSYTEQRPTDRSGCAMRPSAVAVCERNSREIGRKSARTPRGDTPDLAASIAVAHSLSRRTARTAPRPWWSMDAPAVTRARVEKGSKSALEGGLPTQVPYCSTAPGPAAPCDRRGSAPPCTSPRASSTTVAAAYPYRTSPLRPIFWNRCRRSST